MGTRGRKSGAELAIRRRADQVLMIKRPDPPGNLSDEAAMEWQATVGSLPADHFSRATHPMLEAYCNLAVAMRRIDQLIQELIAGSEGEETKSDVLRKYDQLLVMHGRESRNLASIGVRLGIACASRLTSAKPIQGVVSRPWQKEASV